MGQTEYVVKFKGDYSALAKDIDKINGATKKLEDDEVIIKLNYDGNIKQFNKVFDEISKKHPELGIQFQYNVNEKLLKQETDKLKQLTDLKLDIDESKVESKLNSLSDGIKEALSNGMSKDDVAKRLKDFFSYYNTAVKAGAKNIDIGALTNKIDDAFKGSKKDIHDMYMDFFDSGDYEKVQLFKIDKSLNEDLLTAKERAEDIREVLKSLKEKGASETGLPSELEAVQDEIKILKSDIQDMQKQLKNLSGDAFNDMTQQIKETNQQLEFALQMVSNLKAALKSSGIKQDNSIGGIVKQWQDEDITKSRERYTAFNSQSKKTSGAHVAATAEGVGMRLMRSAIEEIGDEADGTIHSHPQKYAAFSDDDIEIYYSLIQEGITQQIVTATEEAISLDMTKVNPEKSKEVVDLVRTRYQEIDNTLLNNLQSSTDAIKEKMMPLLNVNVSNPITDVVLKNIRDNYDDLFDGIMNLEDFDETFERTADYILKQIPEFKKLSATDRSATIENIGGFIDLMHNTVLDAVADNAQKEYQKVLQEVFTNPTFLKSGETSAIKIQALSDFIDWGSITESATEVTKEAADAIKKAQDSNSPAELTKPLGQNFTEGYAEGIREAIPEVVQACKEVVLAAYNAMKEAGDSEDGETVDLSESFISGFRKNLENALPTIQEELQKILSKINVDDDTYTNVIGIGQELIDSIIVGIKNEHSAESFKETIEQVITDAFSNIVLDRATKAIVQQIQSYIDSYTSIDPFVIENFDVNTNSIVVDIQDALSSNKFNINLDGTIKDLSTALNTSADNVRLSFIDALNWIRQANEWQKSNEDKTHERRIYFNTKTGEFSNPTVVGDESSVSSVISDNIKRYYKKLGVQFDSDLHWHQDEDYAAPSFINEWSYKAISGDLAGFFYRAFRDDITKFMVGAQKEIAVFDFSTIASDAKEFNEFLKKWIVENLDEVKDVLKYDKWMGTEGFLENPRKTVSLYISNLYKSLWDDIYKGLYIEDISKETLKQKNTRNHLEDFASHIIEGKPEFVSQTDGEPLLINDIFRQIINKIKKKLLKSGEVDSSIIKNVNKNFEEVIVRIFNDMFLKLGNDSTGLTIDKLHKQVKDSVDEILNNESGNIGQIISDLNLNSYSDDLKHNFYQLLLDHFFEPSVRVQNPGMSDFQEAGSLAMKKLMEKFQSYNNPLGNLVKYYTTEEFEKEFGKDVVFQTSESPQSAIKPTLPEDFQQQLQNAINESGKYFIEIYGKLVDDFSLRINEALGEMIFYIDVEGNLIDNFKAVLQEFIDELGAFKIEVKPYMKKGGEIEEVDLPGGNNQNNNPIYDFYKKYGTPSQAMDKGYNIDEVLQMLGGNFANKSNDIHEPILNAEFFKELIKYLDLTEDELDVIKAALIEIDRYAEGGEFRHLFDSDENADITVNNRLKRIQAIIDGEHKISELEKNNAKSILKHSNQQEANDVETTTKAYLSKKEVVEQLRTELNLTKKAAEDLFNQQGYTKTNNKYQIEQAAVEELIASLKKKQETEESTKPTQTSATATAMQEEVSVVNVAIEEEKKKFDELKNKISKTIPNAVKKKNEAFEQERDLVAKVVDDEIDYFDVLNNTINGVTNSIEKQYDVTKNAKPKLDASDINPEETNITDSTPKSRKTKTTLLSLDKIEQKIREIGLSAQDTEKAIALLGGSKQSFSWMNSELEDQYDKVNALVEIFKRLGIVISSVENSDAWDTTISTNSILDFNKQKYQSVGQKSTIQQEMAEYYTQMQKEAEDIYAKAIQKTSGLTDKIAVLKNSGKYTQDFVNELTNAEKEVENLLNALKAGEVPLEEVDTKVTELANNIENTLAKKAFNDVKLAAEKSLTNVGLKIDQIIAKNSAMGEDFKQRFMTLRKELEDAKSVQAVQKIVAEVNKLESELIQAGKTGKSFIDQIKQRLRDINSKYIAQYFSFQDIIRYAREAFSAVQELNIQMVELAKVSEQSLSQIEDDFNSYANTAKDLGATISDTISATADWARMGYNVPDAKQLAEVALLYKNVGDGIDITAANQSLISTLQGYQMQADEAEHIVDVFNEVANNYAIDTAGIGEALQRSAASLNAANTSLEQSVALVTAANTVVQNPESVGTTFKTLSARIRGAKTDLEELGEEEDEFTQTTSKLQSLVKGLTGFDILEADQKTFKSIYDILIGIGKEWKNLTDIERASLGEALAGKRNANTLYAILDNIETLEDAYETAENAAGSARREQENYEKGIEYSVNKAKAALQELAFDALDSDLLKGLIDMGTNAINLLDTIIDKFGLLKTAIVGIAGVIGSQKLG